MVIEHAAFSDTEPSIKRTKSFMHVFIVIRVHDLRKSEFQQGHVEGDQFRHSQHAWACWDMVARPKNFEIPRHIYMYTNSLIE